MTVTPGELLAARLELLAGDARRVLIAAARSDVETLGLARQLVDGLGARSHTAELVNAADLAGGTSSRSEKYLVCAARGLLDDPATIAAITLTDAVLLAVRPGKTSRADLGDCRVLLEAAGARLVAAVLTS